MKLLSSVSVIEGILVLLKPAKHCIVDPNKETEIKIFKSFVTIDDRTLRLLAIVSASSFYKRKYSFPIPSFMSKTRAVNEPFSTWRTRSS